MLGMRAAALDGAEAEHDGGGNDGQRAQDDLGDVFAARAFEFPNNNQPQKMPTSELVFQSGKAMARPTSRMAKTVRVLATAHSIPARIAMGMRWRLLARSAKTLRVPLSSVGRVQRAVKTPATMQSEMAKGDRPVLTSLVGASAAPSHTPAARPQSTPRPCIDRNCFAGVVALIFSFLLDERCSVPTDQCNVISRARPIAKTTTGMRKWLSVRTARSFSDSVMWVSVDQLAQP